MIFGPSVTVPASYSYLVDRSIGATGASLRQSLASAMAGTGFKDRSEDIYARFSSALAQTQAFSSPDAIQRGIDLLRLLPTSVPLPDVVIESTHEIGLDWSEGRRRVISLTVGDSPMIGYAALFGAEPSYGRMPFTGQVPRTLRFLFRRLYGNQQY
jgi:hypothetical protein